MLDQLKQRHAELVQSEKQRWADLGKVLGAKEEIEQIIQLVIQGEEEGAVYAPFPLPKNPQQKGSEEHDEEQA